jgi:hypothetical protein
MHFSICDPSAPCLFFCTLHIGKTNRYVQVRDIRLALEPHLKWSDVRHRAGENTIEDINKSSKSSFPELHWQASLMKHSCDFLSKGTIELFCNTILLRLVTHSVVSGHSMFNAEVLKLFGHILSTLVILQCSNLDTQLCFCIGLKLLECIKGFRLGLQGNHHLELAMIIDPSTPIAIAWMCAYR